MSLARQTPGSEEIALDDLQDGGVLNPIRHLAIYLTKHADGVVAG
jgi:hypothetical protein